MIFIHIPKAAGQSTRELFRHWFLGGTLLEHYFDEPTGTPPIKHDLIARHTREQPIAVYGHFNRLRGFGVEDDYPYVTQFITILRDPFELGISSYHFIKKTGESWKDQSRVPKSGLYDYLMCTPPNMLNHFPRAVTHHNFRDLIEEFFIDIGIVERLSESLQRIATKLSMPFDPQTVPHRNATTRDQAIPPSLREEYVNRYPLEFEVYEYVRSRFDLVTNECAVQQAVLRDAAIFREHPLTRALDNPIEP